MSKTSLQVETEIEIDESNLFNPRRPELMARRVNALRAEVNRILDKANGRPLSKDELQRCNSIEIEVERIENLSAGRRIQPGDPSNHDQNRPHLQTTDGHAIQCLAPSEKFVNLTSGSDGRKLNLGRAVRGLITGRWEGAQAERLAMAEGSNVGGGYLVPPAFSRELIDLARAASVCVQAGALTIPWTGSDTLSMAAVKTDPTFELKAENSAFTGSDVAFEQITLTAKTIGTLVRASRELAEDASNFPALIMDVLSKAFAAELDRQVLNGSGSGELLGLLNKPTITASDGSVGGIDWETLAAAATAVRLANEEPTAFVVNPQISADLDALTTGDGTNAAKGWLPIHPSMATVRRFATTSCPEAQAVVGDFSKLAIGIRQEAQLEISTVAGDSFAQHQVWIKLTWRGDCCVLRPAAFATLAGITT